MPSAKHQAGKSEIQPALVERERPLRRIEGDARELSYIQ